MTKIPLSDSPVEIYVKRDPKVAQKLCQEHQHPDIYTMEETRIPEVRLFTNDGKKNSKTQGRGGDSCADIFYCGKCHTG